jgi:hypothetical protein
MVKGENLRPYMRVSLNDMQGRAFFFKSASSAEVVFGDIPPGTYDVVLYDNSQERDRLPKSFTLTPAALPPAQLDLAGFLTSVNTEQAAQIKVGTRFGAAAEVLALGKPAPDLARIVAGDKPVEMAIPKTQRIPALLRVNCNVVSGSGGFGACVTGQGLGAERVSGIAGSNRQNAVPDHRGASHRQGHRRRGPRQAEGRSGVPVHSRGRY